jgi:hypothetical protein
MPKVMRLAAITLICGRAALAYGQSMLDAENLLISPPEGFKVGFDSTTGNNSITEFVAAGETVDDWTRMLTVQVYRHWAIDAAAYLQRIGKRFADACPGTAVIGKGIQTGRVNGYAVSMLFLQCPRNPKTGKPETTVFRAIKGNDALYSIQRAWRAIPSREDVNDVMHAMGKVIVCDTRAPEHPCPSYDPQLWNHRDRVPVCDAGSPDHPCQSIDSLAHPK